MKALIFIAVAAISWLIGVFGWSQIIGSIQNIKNNKSLLVTLVIWVIIMVAVFLLVCRFLPNKLLPWAIGTVISLVQVLAEGKVK